MENNKEPKKVYHWWIKMLAIIGIDLSMFSIIKIVNFLSKVDATLPFPFWGYILYVYLFIFTWAIYHCIKLLFDLDVNN